MATTPYRFASVPAEAPLLRAAYEEPGLLQEQGVHVHLFQSHPARLRGRVYTHCFLDQKNQYFEAGAMRLPRIRERQPLLDLIDCLNERV